MKKRKFAEGGMPALEALASGQESGGLDKDTYARALAVMRRRLNEDEGSAGTAKPAAKRARKVEMPAPVSEAKAKMRAMDREMPASRSDDGMRVGPTVERAARMAKQKADEDDMMRPGRDAIENVYPEAVLLGGTGLRGMMGRKKAAEAAGSSERALATSETPRSAVSQRLDALEAGQGRLTKAEAKPSTPRQIARKVEEKNLSDEVLDILRGSNEKRQMPKKEDFGSPKKPDRTRFNEDEEDVEFKRGGKVKKYAAGGAIKMASRRGDGIAQRGKTKGKVC